MLEYICGYCGEAFDEPARWREYHGFTDGLYEQWSACPYCGSCDYNLATIVDQEEFELDADEEVDDEC